MNPKFTEFNNLSNVVIADANMRVAILVSALALAISNTSHLPTSLVDNPTAYFNMQIMPTVSAVVSEWNEEIILDTKMCIEQARMFWLVRYTAAYPMSRPMYSANFDFFDTITGVSLFVPTELFAFLDSACKPAILTLATAATELISNTN
jgi:hypothetical protein